MKTLHNIIALLAVLVCAGCYGDKGNYDYKDVNEMTIAFDHYLITATVGDVIEINPTITFVNGKGDMDRLKFKWYFADGYTQDDWTELNFSWLCDHLIPMMSLCLEVTDPVTGLTYIQTVSCSVSSRYNKNGILVLSEKDGRTQFSYIKISKTESEGDLNHALSCEEFVDVYKMENDEELPANPIKLHQHFCGSVSPGSILVMTKNGVVDISGLDFKKEAVLEEKFDKGTYPAGVPYLADAMFMSRVDLVTDPEGHIYRRLKNTRDLFHSGEFLHRRMRLNNEELLGCRFILSRFLILNGCLVYDELNKRCMVITDSETGRWDSPDDQTAGFPVAIHDAEDVPEGFVPLSNMSGIKLISLEYYTEQSIFSGELGYTMIFERDGKTYCQDFHIEKEYAAAVYSVTQPVIAEVTGLPGTPTLAYPACYRDKNSLVFLAVGNRLFIYDTANPMLPAVEWGAFRDEIVALDGEVFTGCWLTVGLADGSVLLLNAVKCNNPNYRYVYYDSMREMTKLPDLPTADDEEDGGDAPVEAPPVTFGKLIDVRLKIQSASGWDIEIEK